MYAVSLKCDYDFRLKFFLCTVDLQGLDHHGQGLYKTIRKWKLSEFKAITEKEQRLSAAIHGGWVCNYLENHDQARSVSRFMSDSPEHRVISAKSLAMYLLTLSGTPIIYQGEASVGPRVHSLIAILTY